MSEQRAATGKNKAGERNYYQCGICQRCVIDRAQHLNQEHRITDKRSYAYFHNMHAFTKMQKRKHPATATAYASGSASISASASTTVSGSSPAGCSVSESASHQLQVQPPHCRHPVQTRRAVTSKNANRSCRSPGNTAA
ncbi:hypothetical protein DPMN_093980 [Dreissena polymorpha]|uniref:Uncharacterized protein n=1 Tax=Dreissena polymorpha TaxID=45954 RepID=A0A9D4L498_DREPO|nr:hypothetical protein DPMN_093980 [Dreissena polymorpha]